MTSLMTTVFWKKTTSDGTFKKWENAKFRIDSKETSKVQSFTFFKIWTKKVRELILCVNQNQNMHMGFLFKELGTNANGIVLPHIEKV